MERFNIKKRIRSFKYAWKGIRSFISCEHNAWIHLTITVIVIAAGFVFNIQRSEWIVIIFCIGMVLAAECFNTAIERLVNLVSPNKHPIAGDVKDIAAAAVLICAVASGIIGLIIFIPYLFA